MLPVAGNAASDRSGAGGGGAVARQGSAGDVPHGDSSPGPARRGCRRAAGCALRAVGLRRGGDPALRRVHAGHLHVVPVQFRRHRRRRAGPRARRHHDDRGVGREPQPWQGGPGEDRRRRRRGRIGRSSLGRTGDVVRPAGCGRRGGSALGFPLGSLAYWLVQGGSADLDPARSQLPRSRRSRCPPSAPSRRPLLRSRSESSRRATARAGSVRSSRPPTRATPCPASSSGCRWSSSACDSPTRSTSGPRCSCWRTRCCSCPPRSARCAPRSPSRPPVLEEVARSLGRSPARVLRDVTLPLAGPGVAAGAALVFLTCMKELPATLLLRPTGLETLATELWAETEIGAYAAAAPYASLLVLLAAVPTFLLGPRRRSAHTGLAGGRIVSELVVRGLEKSFGSVRVLDGARPRRPRRARSRPCWDRPAAARPPCCGSSPGSRPPTAEPSCSTAVQVAGPGCTAAGTPPGRRGPAGRRAVPPPDSGRQRRLRPDRGPSAGPAGSTSCSGSSGSAGSATACRTSCPAASSSALRSPAR